MFGGTPSRNLFNPAARNIPDEWAVKEGERKNVKWTADLGNVSYGGPVVAGGRVFVGTNNEKPRDPKIKDDHGVVMCFEEATGKFLWQITHEKLAQRHRFSTAGRRFHPRGGWQQPLLRQQSSRGRLCRRGEGEHCLEARHGQGLGVYPHFLANCSPVVVGDLVFVVYEQRRGRGHGEGSQSARRRVHRRGQEEGHGPLEVTLAEEIMDGQWTSPAYAEVKGKGQVIFPGGDGWLRGYEAESGKVIWKFRLQSENAEFRRPAAGGTNYFVATPVVVENRVYIGVGQNPDHGAGVGHLWCIDITKTGDLSRPGDDFDPKAAANKNSGLIWHLGGLINPRPERGRKYSFGRTCSTVAVQDGLVYVAEFEGYMHCLDAQTGQVYWSHDFKANIWGSPCCADGKVYIGTDNGDLCVFPQGKMKKEPKSIDMEAPLKGTPVVANGVLYILTDAKLYAIASQR